MLPRFSDVYSVIPKVYGILPQYKLAYCLSRWKIFDQQCLYSLYLHLPILLAETKITKTEDAKDYFKNYGYIQNEWISNNEISIMI